MDSLVLEAQKKFKLPISRCDVISILFCLNMYMICPICFTSTAIIEMGKYKIWILKTSVRVAQIH